MFASDGFRIHLRILRQCRFKPSIGHVYFLWWRPACCRLMWKSMSIDYRKKPLEWDCGLKTVTLRVSFSVWWFFIAIHLSFIFCLCHRLKVIVCRILDDWRVVVTLPSSSVAINIPIQWQQTNIKGRNMKWLLQKNLNRYGYTKLGWQCTYEGQWWRSSGQRACLLLWRSEFESNSIFLWNIPWKGRWYTKRPWLA